MVIIIDYEMGNLRSIFNAFVALGCDAKITQRPEDLSTADLIVLPGVGAFADGMDKLKQLDMAEALNEQVIQKGKPYLGICLGMQFLATQSLEHGVFDGLNWIPGTVEKIVPADNRFKVPHMGWNDVSVLREDPLFQDQGQNPVFYFVHSYHFVPGEESKDFVTSTCWHGVEVTASIHRENICGVQFHPEKSQGAGLKLLENMLSLIKED
jgi:glutamine amidotransferase